MLGFKSFNDTQKGYITLIFGIILLLHSMNIFRAWLNGILVFVAIGLIIYGVLKTHAISKLISLIQRKKSSNHTTSHTKES